MFVDFASSSKNDIAGSQCMSAQPFIIPHSYFCRVMESTVGVDVLWHYHWDALKNVITFV
mgnify:CR=1 FL=1